MNACFEPAVTDTVPLLRKPKKLTPHPEPMSHRTNGSNLHSALSNLSSTLPPTRTPNTISINRVRNSPRNGNKDFRVIKSGISQDESTVLPNPPTNSPTKPGSSELPDTAVVSYPLQPKGPAPFFPRNKKVFNTQASLYAQLFASTSPVPSSQDQFTLNDFQNIAESISNNTSDSITTVIKSNQNYKKLTSWLEAFPPSQANLNTINLEVNVEQPQVRIPKHQFLLELQAFVREELDVSSAVSLEESEIDQMSVTGCLPPGDIVLQGPVSGYFCGEKRCTSPFALNKPMQSPSDASLLKCMETNCKELNFKAQFMHQLPDISMIAIKLTVLNLSFNMLKVLPSSLFTALNLQELYLRNNPLLLISDEIRKFSLLRIFSASFCLLEEIPLSLFALHRLRELDLSYNRIKRVSYKISILKELYSLNLEGNELPGLPSQITWLEELKHFKITNNYMHPLIWDDYLNIRPDHLQDLCLSSLLREVYQEAVERVPVYLKELFNQRTQHCSNCDLTYFGLGKELIIPSSTPIHSNNSFPILYSLCAERCMPYLRDKLKQQ